MNSMTGYGNGAASLDGSSLTLEIKAVNGKQRDIRCNLPPDFSVAEGALLTLLGKTIARGSIAVSAKFEPSADLKKAGLVIDTALAVAAVDKLRQTAAEVDISPELNLADLLVLPGFISIKNASIPPETAENLLLVAAEKAVLMFNRSRAAEGVHLQADLSAHYRHLDQLLRAMGNRQDDVLQRYRDRLLERIKLLEVEVKLDDERLAKEVAFAAQRSDIAEELARLTSHLQNFQKLLMTPDEPVGRQLQFVCQEIHREINTLGSKTSETDTAKDSIKFKTTLERIKEQIANVE